MAVTKIDNTTGMLAGTLASSLIASESLVSMMETTEPDVWQAAVIFQASKGEKNSLNPPGLR
jgi:hypothetical protein